MSTLISLAFPLLLYISAALLALLTKLFEAKKSIIFFVRSFFGRIRGYQKSFRNYLTFKILGFFSLRECLSNILITGESHLDERSGQLNRSAYICIEITSYRIPSLDSLLQLIQVTTNLIIRASVTYF